MPSGCYVVDHSGQNAQILPLISEVAEIEKRGSEFYWPTESSCTIAFLYRKYPARSNKSAVGLLKCFISHLVG